MIDREKIENLAELIKDSNSTVALSGAGISVPSGIPDFRSPGTGLWENVDPIDVAHIDAFISDPKKFWSFYRPRFGMLSDKWPNKAHFVLAELERKGQLEAVVTQNIDCLHRKAGSHNTVEVHGTIETSSCFNCGQSYSLEQMISDEKSIFDEDGIPRCQKCGGVVKPDVVLFGEMLDQVKIDNAFKLARSADLLLCIGSTLQVQPVASMPTFTKQNGGKVAIITKGPTPYDNEADIRIDGDLICAFDLLSRKLTNYPW